jgi:hypothetical protein
VRDLGDLDRPMNMGASEVTFPFLDRSRGPQEAGA